MAALNPGRYSVGVELAGFRPLSIADVTLLSAAAQGVLRDGIDALYVAEK